MSQYLLFKSRETLHAVEIDYVEGIGNNIEIEDSKIVSAAECFYQVQENEKHLIRFKDVIIKVAEVLDIVEFDKTYEKPSFFRNLPIDGVGIVNENIAILLPLENVVNFCLKRGESHER